MPSPLITIDTTPQPIAAQLAHEQRLVEASRRDKNMRLHIWQCEPAIVVSKPETRLPHFAVALKKMAAQGWPVIARGTGGAAVPQSPQTLNVSWAYQASNAAFDIETRYQQFCQPLITALRSLGVESFTSAVANSFCDGKYNLAVHAAGRTKKIVGTSQKWYADKMVLCHALILVDIDTDHATSLINQFYSSAGSDLRKSPQAVTSLSQLIIHRTNLQAELQSALQTAFTDALETLLT